MKNDDVIGQAMREERHSPRLIHRCSERLFFHSWSSWSRCS